jgi:putative copper export protein
LPAPLVLPGSLRSQLAWRSHGAPFPSQAKGICPQDAAGQLGYRPAVSHVLAATVWVGGQLTLAALVPALRRFGAEVPRAAARRFNQVAWIAFAVLIVTGIWNVAAVSSQISHSASYRDTLIVKLVVVSISAITAALHARARSALVLL